jgi:surface antigen
MKNMFETTELYRIGAAALVGGLLLLLAGCQAKLQGVAGSRAEQQLIARAALPGYVPGEYFVYDDGTSVLVTGVAKGLVSWKHHNGSVSQGYPNFIIPPLSWRSATHSSEGTTDAPPDFLWPLEAGNQGRFTFHQTLSTVDGTPPEQSSRNWVCAVEGTRRVNVPAGEFDTVIVSCKRYARAKGAGGVTGFLERVEEFFGVVRLFYYAPELGHYVLREDRQMGLPKSRRALVNNSFNSTLLPENDQRRLNDTLQSTLSKNLDGVATHWVSRSGTVSAMLVPYRSFRGEKGQPCREYRSTYNVKGRIGQHTREVCRRPDGRWQRVG